MGLISALEQSYLVRYPRRLHGRKSGSSPGPTEGCCFCQHWTSEDLPPPGAQKSGKVQHLEKASRVGADCKGAETVEDRGGALGTAREMAGPGTLGRHLRWVESSLSGGEGQAGQTMPSNRGLGDGVLMTQSPLPHPPLGQGHSQ
jgi:hypothetical protein